MIDRKELVANLRLIKFGINPMACCGCGHEHKCSIHGCAVINDAIARLQLDAAALQNKQRQIDALLQANEGLRYNLEQAGTVVQCRECKSYVTADNGAYCLNNGLCFKPEDYCSYGARKGGDE